MDFTLLTEQLKDRLSERKFLHTLGVAETAKKLAKTNGDDGEKAYLAGLLHDITKELTLSEQLDFCKEHEITLDFVEQHEGKVLHQLTGAYYAKNILNIEDDEVFNAIRYHTTARPKMSIVEKAVYLADCIEPNRIFLGVEKMRAAAKKSIDNGMAVALSLSVYEVMSKKSMLHENTINALNEYIQILREKGETYEY